MTEFSFDSRNSNEKLTSELAGEVVFNSFRYSQGSKNLQLLLQKIAIALRPSWKPSEKLSAYLDSDAYFDRIYTFATSKAHGLGTAFDFAAKSSADPREARGSIRLALVKDGVVPFSNALHDRKQVTQKDLLEAAMWMVERDVYFMQLRRQSRDWKPRETSQFIDLVLKRQKSQGPRVFDEIFSLIHTTLRTAHQTEENKRNVESMLNNMLELLEWHNSEYPQEKINIADHLSVELFTVASDISKRREAKRAGTA